MAAGFSPFSRRHAVAALVMLIAASTANAQIDAPLTQYFQMPSYFNPGAIGTTDLMCVSGGSRLQWVGIPRSPRTFLAAAQTPFRLLERRWGAGAIMQQEAQGLYSTIVLGVQGAWQKRFAGGERILSIGLQCGLIDQSFKGSEVILPEGDNYHQTTDDGIPTSDIHGTTLTLGGGVWYSTPRWWVGLSATHINSPTVTMETDGGGGTTSARQYEFRVHPVTYFATGCNIPIKNTLLEVLPSMLVRSDMIWISGEATARIRYNRMLSAGLGYRSGDAVAIMAGIELQQLTVSYSYDIATGALSRSSGGSHELWASYAFKLDLGEKNRHRHKSIRIM